MLSKRPRSVSAMSPVKFINDRSASAKVVASSTATVLPDTTNAGIDRGGGTLRQDGEQPVAALEINDVGRAGRHTDVAEHTSADNIGERCVASGADRNAVGGSGVYDDGFSTSARRNTAGIAAGIGHCDVAASDRRNAAGIAAGIDHCDVPPAIVEMPVLLPELVTVTLPVFTAVLIPSALPELVTVTLPVFTDVSIPPVLLPELVAVTLPVPLTDVLMPPVLVPEFVFVMLPELVNVSMPPVLLPEFVFVTLPEVVIVAMPPVLLPEFVFVTLPEVVIVVMPPVLLPEFVFVTLPEVVVVVMPPGIGAWVSAGDVPARVCCTYDLRVCRRSTEQGAEPNDRDGERQRQAAGERAPPHRVA
jgi:hypothetical protein